MNGILGDEFFMHEALKEAKKAFEEDEVPVGAVMVNREMIIARGHNLMERLRDVTAHAEMQVITAAANHLGTKSLEDCTLYVTLEPCPMCAGALQWARPARVVYAAGDPKHGFLRFGKTLLHPATELGSGVLEKESTELLRAFFKKKRD